MAPPPSLTVTTLPPLPLPSLPRIQPRSPSTLQRISPPQKRIDSDEDLLQWKNSRAYADLVLFVGRLGEAAVGKETRWPRRRNDDDAPGPASSSPADIRASNWGIEAVIILLETLHQWIKEIEPKKTPQRFGNLAFRDWGARLQERAKDLHLQLLANHPHLHVFIPELSPYLVDSFGSFVRIDYGSGHEVTFVAWLGLLFKLGFFDEHDRAQTEACTVASSEQAPTQVETALGLEVFPLYLQVVWALQDCYALEPAGSHGVWGLDDYHFIPYIIGSAQLRLQTSYLPSHFSSKSHKPTTRLSPAELLQYLPSSASTAPSAPFANLFTSSIARIHALKSGSFHEHSPLLYDVSTSVMNWVKVNKGMGRMWEAEVLGKRPVVQHFRFGGVGWIWEGGEKVGEEVARVEKVFERQTGLPHSMAELPASAPATVPLPTNGVTQQRSTSSMPPPTSMTTRGESGAPRGATYTHTSWGMPPPPTLVSGSTVPWTAGGTSTPWTRKG